MGESNIVSVCMVKLISHARSSFSILTMLFEALIRGYKALVVTCCLWVARALYKKKID